MSATRAQANVDVGQTLAECHLGKAHAKELFPARKVTHLVIAIVAGDTATELFGMNPFHDLRKNSLAEMHERILGKNNVEENAREKALATPDRSHFIFVLSTHVSACSVNILLAQPDDSDAKSPDKPRSSEQHAILRGILAHLSEYPNAQDTVEGIAEWWGAESPLETNADGVYNSAQLIIP